MGDDSLAAAKEQASKWRSKALGLEEEVQQLDSAALARRPAKDPSKKSAKQPDPPIFVDGIDPTWDDWSAKIREKMRVNADHFSTEDARVVYVLSRLGGQAVTYTYHRREKETTNPYVSYVVYIPRPNLFQRRRQLPIKIIEMVKKVMTIILLGFHKPKMLLSITIYKARTYGIPNLDFRRSRKVSADIPTAFYEQYLFATADIGPSFGLSIQNAETESRSLLERVEGNIGRQADIVALLREILDSFTLVCI